MRGPGAGKAADRWRVDTDALPSPSAGDFLQLVAAAALAATALAVAKPAAADVVFSFNGSGKTTSSYMTCSNINQTISLNASARPMDGYNVQWIAAQFLLRNLDTGKNYLAPSATQWSYFQNTYRQISGQIATSPWGETTLTYNNIPAGRYDAYVRYSWLTGSGWTTATDWTRIEDYGYNMWSEGVDFPRTMSYCLVDM